MPLTNEQIADKLREKAGVLMERIEKLAVPRLVNTRKRRQEDEYRQRELHKFRTIHAAMLRLSNMHIDGTVPLHLESLKSTAEFERVVGIVLSDARSQIECPSSHQERLNTTEKAMKKFLSGLEESPLEESQEQKLHRMERDIVPGSIKGYFPTQRPVVERMIEDADIENGMTMLEPEAGKGDISDVLAERFPLNRLDVCEAAPSLASILKLKHRYTDFIGTDILEIGRDFPAHRLYDRILMNPPFENGQDIQHVRHCFDNLLAPGGRLVSIMAPGAFFKTDKKSTDFRLWFKEAKGWDDKLPDDSFKASGTGVSSVIVCLDKPGNYVSASLSELDKILDEATQPIHTPELRDLKCLTKDKAGNLTPEQARVMVGPWWTGCSGGDLLETKEGRQKIHRAWLRNTFNEDASSIPSSVLESHATEAPAFNSSDWFSRELDRRHGGYAPRSEMTLEQNDRLKAGRMDEATQPEITPVEGGFEISRKPCPTCGEPPFGDEYCCGCEPATISARAFSLVAATLVRMAEGGERKIQVFEIREAAHAAAAERGDPADVEHEAIQRLTKMYLDACMKDFPTGAGLAVSGKPLTVTP